MSAAQAGRRRSGGHARRPRPPLHRRLGSALPSAGRLLALTLFAALVCGLVALANGPWLRVARIELGGQTFTPATELERLLEPYRGRPLLTIDSVELAAAVGGLPAVAAVHVQPKLPDELRITVEEKEPAFMWRAATARLVGAGDGTLIASLPPDVVVPFDLRHLPLIDDERFSSRTLAVGDQIAPDQLRIVLRLVELDPRLLGSRATQLSVAVTDDVGYTLVSPGPEWRAALGAYGQDPADSQELMDARLDQQIAAIRTLFASTPERRVSWVDARNPGKVYWAP